MPAFVLWGNAYNVSMKHNAFDVLKRRGFLYQCSNEKALRALFVKGPVTFYIGFDPTADSLHIGNLAALMAMRTLQRHGHIPIAVLGGGTVLVGDPSGKTTMRPMLAQKELAKNSMALKKQFQQFLSLSGKKGYLVNNADWLKKLTYIDFLREIGRHFRVNEMIKADAYKQRLEREEGLSFLEFNYQLLQGYDFLHLFRTKHCILQMGGADQWSNILAGVELVRKLENADAFALTIPLLTTASGAKMGKTEQGAVWLDAKKTSPYEFYQYWMNTDDRDVERFLLLFTDESEEDIKKHVHVKGAAINTAKEALAYQVTALVHGEKQAQKAQEASRAAFGKGEATTEIPTTTLPLSRFQKGILVVDLLVVASLSSSKSEARRLILQGGASINGTVVSAPEAHVTTKDLENGEILLRAGKKRYRRIVTQ